MKGIIIAGGLGTRLRPLTYQRPKPLMPVAGRPFLEYQVALLRAHGIDDIVFATNYMAEQIEAHFGDGSRFGVRMRYAVEEQPLGTGGAIRNAADMFPGEAVCVFNGDILTDFDLSSILAFHRDRGARATITLFPVARPNPFGVLVLDAHGQVLEWREPSEAQKKALAAGQAPPEEGMDLINAGFYLLEPQIIERIPAGERSSVERDIYPQLISDRAGLYGFAPPGFWMDLGHPEQLLTASRALLTGEVRAAVPAIPIGEGAQIASTARIDSTTSIGASCRIGEESRIENAVIMENVTIGTRVYIQGAIVDRGAVVEDDAAIIARHGAAPPVVAAGSVLGRGTQV